MIPLITRAVGGSVSVLESDTTHPLVSVTTTEYVFADNVSAIFVLSPLDQA